MWILQGLMVCCVIMGMSSMAQAESFRTKLKEYKQEVNEELKDWKIDNLKRKKELRTWKKESFQEAKAEKLKEFDRIEKEYTSKVKELAQLARKKSKKFQLKSDLALVRSIKLKRAKLNQRKKVLQDYYSKLEKIELTYNEKYKEFKLDSYKEKQELLNDNKPDFFPDFAKLKNIKDVKEKKKVESMKKQFCKIQSFFQKQQFKLDYNFSRYENIRPVEMNVKRLKRLKELADHEVEVLDESLNAMRVMVEQIGKTPKELKRLKKQIHKARKSQKYYQKKYDEDVNQLTFLKQGLKAATSRRKEQLSCDSEIMITNIESPKNMNVHLRIGEVY